MKRKKSADSGLTPRQMRYIAGLLAGKPKNVAARDAGVSDRCARNWHNDPRFQRALRDAIDTTLRDTLTGVVSLLPDAVDAFTDGLRYGTPQQRASVAEKLVTTLLRLRVDVDFAERVQKLETMMGANDAGTTTPTAED